MDDDTVEEIKRHFGVVAEDLRDRISAFAEGQDALRTELKAEISELRDETRREFAETRALIKLSFGQLESRLSSLETDVADLRGRMERAESRLSS